MGRIVCDLASDMPKQAGPGGHENVPYTPPSAGAGLTKAPSTRL